MAFKHRPFSFKNTKNIVIFQSKINVLIIVDGVQTSFIFIKHWDLAVRSDENPPFPTTSGAIAWPRPCSERVQFSVLSDPDYFRVKNHVLDHLWYILTTINTGIVPTPSLSQTNRATSCFNTTNRRCPNAFNFTKKLKELQSTLELLHSNRSYSRLLRWLTP